MSNPDSRTLLIIGAGIEQVPGILLAKKRGLFVVAVDGNPQAPGFVEADDYGVFSTYDVDGVVNFAKQYSRRKRRIDGVMTLASDVPLTVSAVARALRLPGHSLVTARRASDKLLMKRVFRTHGVPIPEFASVNRMSDLERFIQRHDYPVVLKPVDSRGARGVLRLTPSIDLAWALKTSRQESPTGRVMVEKFVPGRQISTESVIYGEKIITTGLADRNYEFLEKYAPYMIENGGEIPAALTVSEKKKLDLVLIRAAKALGVKKGSIKGDVVYTPGGPKIIEVAARLSGGYFATDSVPLSTGVNIVSVVIDIAIGKTPDLRELHPKFNRVVCQRFYFPPKPGVIKRIVGSGRVHTIPGVEKFHLYIRPGEPVRGIVSHPSRLGYVTVCAPTRAQAIRAANRAVEAVKFVVG